jgi:hypothetical protein
MFRQTHLLIWMRCRSVSNRLMHASSVHWLRLVAGSVLAASAILWLGDRCAAFLLRVPEAVATPGLNRALVSGQAALEAAFWVSAIGSAVLSFRVMESLFRRPDVRVLEALPVCPYARFVDRTMIGISEAILVAVSLATFFVPLVWHSAPFVAGISALQILAALGITVPVSIAVNVHFGSRDSRADSSSRASIDPYSGTGQAFVFGPGVALAFSLVVCLLIKLALGELLVHGRPSNAFWLGVGISVCVAFVALISGLRDFVRCHGTIAASFREAETVGFGVLMEYQKSNFGRRLWGERILGSRDALLYRASALQLQRCSLLARYGYGGFVVAVGASVLWNGPAAIPNWSVACTPIVLFAVLTTTWRKVMEAAAPFAALPVSEMERIRSDTLMGLREVLLPSICIAGFLLWARRDAVEACLFTVCVAPAINGVVSLLRSFRMTAISPSTKVPFLTGLAAASGAILHLPVAALILLGIALGGNAVPWIFKGEQPLDRKVT